MILIFLEGILWFVRFLFGACIFSFLMVVADRLPKGESVVSGRSHCDACGRMLTAGELIPCFSYLFLRGKCKGCGARIPAWIFLAEVLGGAAFVACGRHFGYGSVGIVSLRGAVIFIYLGILLVVALIDWETQIIYDRFHGMILLLGLAAVWLFPAHGIRDRLIGAVVIALPMLVLTLIIPGAFGGGDIKLLAASGFLLGTAATVVGAFIGIVGGGIFAAVMLAAGRLSRKDHFAFGPFLAAGLAVAALYGDLIAGWYLGFVF